MKISLESVNIIHTVLVVQINFTCIYLTCLGKKSRDFKTSFWLAFCKFLNTDGVYLNYAERVLSPLSWEVLGAAHADPIEATISVIRCVFITWRSRMASVFVTTTSIGKLDFKKGNTCKKWNAAPRPPAGNILRAKEEAEAAAVAAARNVLIELDAGLICMRLQPSWSLSLAGRIITCRQFSD